MSLQKSINDSRNIKENSLRAYMISLRKLHEKLETDADFDSIDDWLCGKNVEKIINLLSDMKITTRKNYIAAVIVALTTDKDKYEEQLNLYQLYLVGLLYTELPPVRLDYSNMMLITEKDYKKLKEKDKNYLVLVSRNKKYFSLGSYKTEDKYGVHIIEIPTIINSVINKFLQHNTSGFFLVNTQRNMLTDNGLTKLLNKVFAATGKKISSTMIRHIYLSGKYDANQEEMEKDAAAMLHSVGTQQGVYVKK